MKLIGILAIVLLLPAAYACPAQQDFLHLVKKGLFQYLANPAKGSLNTAELKDLVSIYITGEFEGADCRELVGDNSHEPIIALLEIAKGIPDDSIPACSDGTEYGVCSSEKPYFCYSGRLSFMCSGPDRVTGNDDDCGCANSYEKCMSDGTCQAYPVLCTKDDDCGPSNFAGDTRCSGTAVVDDYLFWKCTDPGTIGSGCEFAIEERAVMDCYPDECIGGACV